MSFLLTYDLHFNWEPYMGNGTPIRELSYPNMGTGTPTEIMILQYALYFVYKNQSLTWQNLLSECHYMAR